MSDIIGSYSCPSCGRTIQSGKWCTCADTEVRRIFGGPEPGSVEEMLAEHNYATRDVSRAEFEALTLKVDAMLTALRKVHNWCYSPGLDLSKEVQCQACEAIRELEAKLGLS